MATAIVYILNSDNQITSQFKCDYNYAIFNYHGKRDRQNNRYYIGIEGKPVPFKPVPKKTYNITARPPDTLDPEEKPKEQPIASSNDN